MSASTAEILVCTLGTRGDVLPFLSLCRPFLEDGHKVTILTNRNWRELVEGIGAQFHEIADADPSQSGRDDKAFFRSSTFPSFARSFSFIQAKIEHNPKCVLIYRVNMLGAECAAEKFRLPSVKVALQPSAIRSSERPPWPLTPLTLGPLAGLAKKTIIPAIYKFGDLAAGFTRYTNSFRREVGLRKIAFGKRNQVEDLFLVCCPEWFAMPQKDWPASSRLTGFLYFDAMQQDDELSKFVEDHGAPLVFTPGTGVSDVREFFQLASGICKALRIPGVFISPAPPDADSASQDMILVRGYAELHWLLPRSRLLVHHGGIGTVAQAIRAGVPQVILPDRFDQPDNALRVALLGLGGAVFSKPAAAAEVADLVRRILASPAVEKQVRIGAALVRAHPASDLAYQMICGVMRHRFGAPARLAITAQGGENLRQTLLLE